MIASVIKDPVPAKVLRLVLGDQLDSDHSWFSSVDQDCLYVIAELAQEQTYVRHHIQKTLAFFLAMAGFALKGQAMGHRFDHYDLDETVGFDGLPAFLDHLVVRHQVERVEYQLPDEYRLRIQLLAWSERAGVEVVAVESEHFLLSEADREAYFKTGKAHRMEHFYRKMRVRFDVLMLDNEPLGGRWNFDQDNRKRFPKNITLPEPMVFANEGRATLERIRRHQLPTIGETSETSIWPIDKHQANQLLNDFCQRLLPDFGRYQDAMTDHGWSLYHSRLAFALNVKLLHPKTVIDAVIAELKDPHQRVDMAQVEGFVRQILGWREFIRGIYWANMPDYGVSNALEANLPLPALYWSGETHMACMRQAIGQSLKFAYGHHIQRLMVTGNFALLLGVDPTEVEAWYLGIYIDAIEWVEMPNTRGMSQFADGGLVASKPYISSGKYIQRMSDHCKSCKYDVNLRSGELACPFNVLYWDFLDRHEQKFARNPRMRMMLTHFQKINDDERQLIATSARRIRQLVSEVPGSI